MRRNVLLALLLLSPVAAFAQGSPETRVSVTGGQTARTWHGQADLQALNVELGRAVSPRTDVAFVFAPMNVWQPRSWFGDQYGDGNESVRALSGSLLVRRRFGIDSARLQYYAEASTGPMWAEKAVPASTSRFNFLTQFGAGVILLRHSRLPITAGYRFLHISNGGYSPRNPGINASAVMLGIQVR
jgi:hypothetical protein